MQFAWLLPNKPLWNLALGLWDMESLQVGLNYTYRFYQIHKDTRS